MTSAENLRLLQKSHQEEFERLKKQAQNECGHPEVLHWAGFTDYGTYNPERRCVLCGYTETGGWWCYSFDCSHWHDKNDSSKKVLAPKDGRVIREVSEEEFCRAAV